jgi:pimeloyl-ACP methyl ester carboxylesterase
LDCSVTYLRGRVGTVAFYAAGETQRAAPPILLVHTVNASGSAFEVRPLFEAYRSRRPTYALDLPGFGLSERSPRRYTPRLMTDALHEAVEEIGRRHPGVAIDAVAASLSSEFLARAATETPTRFKSLSLVSPTGFEGGSRRYGAPESTREVPGLHAILAHHFWSRPLFRGLTRPGVIRYFLRRTWGGPNIDEGLWRYDIEATAVEGAEHAPLCFLSGMLFSADVHRIYDQLALPVWVAHGVRGDFTDFRRQDEFRGRDHWRFQSLPTGALPYFEVLDEFLEKQATALSWG